jgi:hypothetical protein
MNIGWEEALEAMYGTQVSDKQVPIWEHYLKADNTNSAELVEAIGMAAEDNLKPVEWRVTVRDLRIWLKRYRAIKIAELNKASAKDKRSAFVAEWREKMDRGASQDDFLAALDSLPIRITDRNDICREVLSR